MAVMSSSYNIQFAGSDGDLLELNRLMTEKLEQVKQTENTQFDEFWCWLEQYDSEKFSCMEYESPLSDAWQMEEFLGEIKKKLPDILIWGEVELCWLMAGGSLKYTVVSEQGSEKVIFYEMHVTEKDLNCVLAYLKESEYEDFDEMLEDACENYGEFFTDDLSEDGEIAWLKEAFDKGWDCIKSSKLAEEDKRQNEVLKLKSRVEKKGLNIR